MLRLLSQLLIIKLTLSHVQEQTDITALDASQFLLTNWVNLNGPIASINSCSTLLLKVNDQQTVAKTYEIIAKHFTSVRFDINLYFYNFVDSRVTIQLSANSVFHILYDQIITLSSITTSTELCGGVPGYQLTISNSIPFASKYMELTIYYEHTTPNPSSYLGIRDIHILSESEQGPNRCIFDQPLLSSEDIYCVKECSLGEQIGGYQLDHCIKPSDQTNVDIITPIWTNNYESIPLVDDSNYPDVKKYYLFNSGYTSSDFIIKDQALFGAIYKIQVVMLIYLFDNWNNGDYLKFSVIGDQTVDLFTITSSGTTFQVSTGAVPNLIQFTLLDTSTISGYRIMLVAEASAGSSTTWQFGLIQNIQSSSATYAIGYTAIYRAKQDDGLCQTYRESNYCISCFPPNYAYYGKCIPICPTYSLISDSDRNCIDYLQTETKIANPTLPKSYFSKQEFASFRAQNYNSPIIYDYFNLLRPLGLGNAINKQYFSMIQKRKVVGGYNSWGSQTYAKQYMLTSVSHTQIRIYFTIYFIDNWVINQKFKITIDSTILIETIDGLVGQQIVGNSALDYVKKVSYKLPHSSSSVTILFECNADAPTDSDIAASDSSLTSCGIQDFYLYTDEECYQYCLTCDGPNQNQCLQCDDTANRELNSNQECICKGGYEDLIGICTLIDPCDETCLLCFAENDANQCFSCNPGSHRQLNTIKQCICELGYVSDGVDCYQIPCHYSCDTCSQSNSISSCLSCPDQTTSHRIVGANNDCICENNYSDIQGQVNCSPICHQTCQTCSIALAYNSCLTCDTVITHRVLVTGNECLCSSQYYDPGNQIICSPICHSNCLTCFGILENECLSCDNSITANRVLIGNECICDEGYVELGQQCQIECSPLCLTCLSQQNCLSCKPESNSLLIDNQCVCGLGQYANVDNCFDCPTQCLSCLNTDLCTECDITQQRILVNEQCLCQSEFREVNGICSSCDLNDGWLSTDCIKRDCNDGIFTFGEGCDDGNNDNRDGCASCQVQIGFACQNTPLNPSICQKCSTNCEQCEFDGVCTKCESGYQIDRTGFCVQCQENCMECQGKDCIICKITLKNIQITTDLKECPLCEDQSGMYSSPTDSSVCIAVCGDHIQVAELNEECDDGNLLDGDGCSSTCKQEEGYDCHNQVCFKPPSPIPYLQEINSITTDSIYYNSNRSYSLNYSLFIFDDKHLQEKITFSIQNSTLNEDYYLSSKEVILNSTENGYCNYSIIYQIQLLKTFEQKEIEIQFNKIQEILSIQGVQQQIQNITVLITDYYYQSEELLKTTKNLMDSNQIVLYILLAIVSFSLITGGLDAFWNLLDLIQLLSYIIYIDTRYPYNLQSYLELFQFGQLNFLDNLLNLQSLLFYVADEVELDNYQPLPIFQDYQSTLFFLNFCSILTTFIIIFTLYIVFRLTNYVCNLIQFNLQRICIRSFTLQIIIFTFTNFLSHYSGRFVDSFFYSVLIRANMSVVYDLGFAIFLQLTEQYSNMRSILSKTSYIMAIVTLISQLYLVYFYTTKTSEQFKYKLYQQKYGQALLDTLKVKEYCTISSYYNVFLIFKRFAYIFMLVALVGEPQIQTIGINIILSINIVFLLHKRPFNSKFEFFKQFSCEIFMQLLHLQISLFTIDDEINLLGEVGRNTIGWLCIVEISLIMGIQLIIDMIQQIQYNYKNIKSFRKLIDKCTQRFHKHKIISEQKQRIFY